MSILILGSSTVLQYLAAVLALRLIWITKRRAAWVFIATAVFLMAVRRSISLWGIVVSERPPPITTNAELVALLISVLMVAGIALIAPYFRDAARAGEDVKESEARLSAILDNTHSVVFLKDLEGRYQFINKKGEAMFDMRRADFVGKTDFDLFPKDVAERFRADDQAVLESGDAKQSDDQLERPGGGTRDYLSMKFPLRRADGEIYALCGISTDITERLRAEKNERELETNLQYAQKLESLGVMAGGIAHDFNNLLVPILAATELMQLGEPQNSEETNSNLEVITSAAMRAAELCRQLLAYSGRGRFTTTLLDVSAEIEKSRQLIEMSIKGVEIDFDLAQNLPTVEADATQLQQIVMNLVVNAGEAGGDTPVSIRVTTGTVDVTETELDSRHMGGSSAAPGHYVFLKVTDTGTGMNEETLARLFEPFFTTKFTGRGLGLSAVIGIIRGHKGSINVESEVGKGTTIRVLFPASDKKISAGQEPRSTKEPAAAHGTVGTVLIIDDEKPVRAVAQKILERSGFKTLCAADGPAGLELFREHAGAVAVVLLDMTMPKMSGAAAFAELRKLNPEVRVVLSSGYDEPTTRADHRFVGLAGFLQKPCDATELVSIIRKVSKEHGEEESVAAENLS